MSLKEDMKDNFMDNLVDNFIGDMQEESIKKNLYLQTEDAFSIREIMFEDIVKKMFEIYKAKNRDYGMSVKDTYEKFGLTSFLVRLSDKLNRLISLDKKKEILVKDEKIEDTLLDLANYAVIALIETKLNEGENNEH